jgi:hypothetical protein
LQLFVNMPCDLSSYTKKMVFFAHFV